MPVLSFDTVTTLWSSIIRLRLYENCQVGTTLLWAGIPAAVYLQSLNPCDIWNLVPRKLLEGTL